jgi:hypothetical protein
MLLHQLQGHRPRLLRIVRAEHHAHAADGELLDDLVPE